MRITTGRWRGRAIAAPPGDAVRPTSDKVRQAVFNILLGHDLPQGAVVLDAFCGTGALGLEALSRGAALAIFMDRAIGPCRKNVETFGAGGAAILLERDALRPGRPGPGQAASLAFLDPPYRQTLAPQALEALAAQGWLVPGAICVAETESEAAENAPPGFAPLGVRRYGGTKILFLRYETIGDG